MAEEKSQDKAETHADTNSSQISETRKNKKARTNNILLALVVIIVLLSLITVFLNSKTDKTKRDTGMAGTPAPTSVVSPFAQSVLSLEPDPVTVDASGNGVVNVNIKTNENEVTAVQLELLYDPEAITNVAIKPADFFSSPVELLKRIDKENGRITYMIGISPTQNPVVGTGTVAQITFTKATNTDRKSTNIRFSRTESSESIVAATGIDESVLKRTKNTKINLTR